MTVFSRLFAPTQTFSLPYNFIKRKEFHYNQPRHRAIMLMSKMNSTHTYKSPYRKLMNTKSDITTGETVQQFYISKEVFENKPNRNTPMK